MIVSYPHPCKTYYTVLPTTTTNKLVPCIKSFNNNYAEVITNNLLLIWNYILPCDFIVRSRENLGSFIPPLNKYKEERAVLLSVTYLFQEEESIRIH